MSIIDSAAIATALLSVGYWLFLIARPRRGSSPLVEPAPDAFPIRYHDPYVPSPIASYVNGRPYRLDNAGKPIYGYQPTDTPLRQNPPQSISASIPVEAHPHKSDHPLLNRPPNPRLDIVYRKDGKPRQKIGQSSEALLALMKRVEERAPSALAGMPYQPTDAPPWRNPPRAEEEPDNPFALDRRLLGERIGLTLSDEAAWAYSVAVSLSSVKQELAETAWEGEELAYE